MFPERAWPETWLRLLDPFLVCWFAGLWLCLCALNTAKNVAVAITVGGTVGTTVGSTVLYSIKMVRYGKVRYGTVLYGTSTGTVQYGIVLYGTVPYCTVWYIYRTVRYRYENLEILERGEADPI